MQASQIEMASLFNCSSGCEASFSRKFHYHSCIFMQNRHGDRNGENLVKDTGKSKLHDHHKIQSSPTKTRKMSQSRLFFFFCTLFFSAFLVHGQNVATTTSGVAIGTNGGQEGLLVSTGTGGERQQFEVTNFGLGVSLNSPFSDVSIDPENESLVFALSTSTMTACSFLLDVEATEDSSILTMVSCVGGFAVSPFSGISANGGTLMISGGTGGFTIYEYHRQLGFIVEEPTLLNQEFPNIIGHPDIVLVHAYKAALSTDFNGGSSRFGTQMASIDASRTSVTFGSDYRVQGTLGFQLFVQPSNFPLVNAVFRSSIMYTANGPMQVQDLESDEVTVLSGAPSGFSAVTVAVNQATQKLYFGGILSSGRSLILIYDLSEDPINPTLVGLTQEFDQRITSIASGGDAVAYMTTTDPGTIQFMEDLNDEPIELLNSEPIAPPTTTSVTTAEASSGSVFSWRIRSFVFAVAASVLLF